MFFFLLEGFQVTILTFNERQVPTIFENGLSVKHNSILTARHIYFQWPALMWHVPGEARQIQITFCLTWKVVCTV